jgi:hypothetical protein
MSEELFDAQVASLKQYFAPLMYPKGALKEEMTMPSREKFIILFSIDMSRKPQCGVEDVKNEQESWEIKKRKTPRVELTVTMYPSKYAISIKRIMARGHDRFFNIVLSYEERGAVHSITKEKGMAIDLHVANYIYECLGIDMSFSTMSDMRKNLDVIGMPR